LLKVSRLAPYIFVLLWSTGFVGAKFGLPYADPFIFLAIRLFIAALILFGIAVLLKSPVKLTRIQIRSSALIGVFLHAAYLGGVFFAISQGVSAGTAAVITSLQPVLVSVLAIKILNERLRGSQILGLVLGLFGVVLVLGPSFESSVSQLGILAVFIALIGSTTATLLQKKIGSGIPLLAGTAYQYCASGLLLLIAAVATGDTQIQWSIKFAGAMMWLIFVLSVGAILLLLWLLNTASAASVSSLFYLVPPATAIEAYFLFGEKLNTQSLLGIAVTALGVWCVLRAAN
jgi:drug/metabolite transporter (DMT)-like permease